ncbi:MAG TPA: septation protein A [Gammaproteobacteria bacterium]|nr:septation protein A [Gammaproteobacteria bacterium]
MKLLFDFFPIVLFFIAYKTYDIYVATVVVIVASFIQVAVHWLQHRRFENMHLITLALVIVMGGATLLLQNELFIQWKPTVINWLFAAVFIGSQSLFGKQPIMQRMLGKSISLTDALWVQLNLAWAIFFIISGLANLYVVYNYDMDAWVNFKLFGMMGMTLVFIVAQGIWLAKHMKTAEVEK